MQRETRTIQTKWSRNSNLGSDSQVCKQPHSRSYSLFFTLFISAEEEESNHVHSFVLVDHKIKSLNHLLLELVIATDVFSQVGHLPEPP